MRNFYLSAAALLTVIVAALLANSDSDEAKLLSGAIAAPASAPRPSTPGVRASARVDRRNIATQESSSSASDEIAAGQRVSAWIDLVHETMAKDLLDDPLYEKYLECVGDTGAQCLPLLADALFSSMSLRAEILLDDRQEELELAAKQLGAEAYYRLAEEKILAADEVTGRVAAMLLVRKTPELEARAWSSGLYDGIAGKNDAEIQLLLHQHMNVLLPNDEVAEEVQRLAARNDVDGRVRMYAIRALGHDRYANRLRELSEQVATGSLPVGLGSHLEFALGQCGSACLPSLVLLGSQREPAARKIAYGALKLFPSDSLRYAQELLTEASPLTQEQARTEMAELDVLARADDP